MVVVILVENLIGQEDRVAEDHERNICRMRLSTSRRLLSKGAPGMYI